MSDRGVSIWKMMAVVAVVAVDCALLRVLLASRLPLLGFGITGLALSAVLVVMTLTRGAVQRFAIGFAAGILAGLAVLVAMAVHDERHHTLKSPLARYYQATFPWVVAHRSWLPLPLTEIDPNQTGPKPRRRMTVMGVLVFEAVDSLPMMIPALLCGGLGLAVRRRPSFLSPPSRPGS